MKKIHILLIYLLLWGHMIVSTYCMGLNTLINNTTLSGFSQIEIRSQNFLSFKGSNIKFTINIQPNINFYCNNKLTIHFSSSLEQNYFRHSKLENNIEVYKLYFDYRFDKYTIIKIGKQALSLGSQKDANDYEESSSNLKKNFHGIKLRTYIIHNYSFNIMENWTDIFIMTQYQPHIPCTYIGGIYTHTTINIVKKIDTYTVFKRNINFFNYKGPFIITTGLITSVPTSFLTFNSEFSYQISKPTDPSEWQGFLKIIINMHSQYKSKIFIESYFITKNFQYIYISRNNWKTLRSNIKIKYKSLLGVSVSFDQSLLNNVNSEVKLSVLSRINDIKKYIEFLGGQINIDINYLLSRNVYINMEFFANAYNVIEDDINFILRLIINL